MTWSTPLNSTRRRLLVGVSALIIAAKFSPTFAADKEAVTFAIITSLSGPQAEYGKQAVDLATLFADKMNASGGISGRKVEILTGDHQDQPDVFISLARRYAAEHKISGFLGLSGSGLSLAFEKAMKSTQIPIMLHYVWGDHNTGPDLPSVFRVGPFNSYVAGLMAKFLIEKNYKSVVVLAEDTAYGTDYAAGLKAAIGNKVKVDIIDYQAQATDLSPVLGDLAQRDPQPDAIVTAGNYQIIYNLQNQVPAAGLKSQIIGSWDYPTTPQYWETSGKNGIGIIYSSFTGPSMRLTPTGEAFREMFAGKYGRDPVFYEYFLWDDFNALRVAIEKSGSTEPATLTKTLPDVDFEGTMRQIRFERKPDTPIWNQALAGTLFLKQMTAQGQSDAQAKVIYEASP